MEMERLSTRDEAMALLREYTEAPGLLKHALSVDPSVRTTSPFGPTALANQIAL